MKNRFERCNCENRQCEREGLHVAGNCHGAVGKARAMYVGRLCDACARRMPREYLYPPHGAARR